MSARELPWLPNIKIAFTFTGEYREKIVRSVCEELLKYGYRKEEIFFDEWHPELFTGVNADTVFREIYHDKSQCVVVLLSPNYIDKLWTGNLEWPTVRALINEGTHHKICLLRVDDVDINKIEGLYASRDVARSVDDMTPAQIARFLHRWYCIHVLKQSPDAGRSKSEHSSGEAREPEAPAADGRSESAREIAAAEKLSPAPEHAPPAAELKWLENGNLLFGSYPQTAEGERRPIEWLVLKREADRALLISRYALDAKLYNKEFIRTTWEQCSLRRWLNGPGKEDFPQIAFTAEERERILRAVVSADLNPVYGTDPGRATVDRLFLLSIPEAEKLFASDRARRCAPTDYAKARGVYFNADFKADGRPSCRWWLRSPGNYSYYAAYVGCDGSVNGIGFGVLYDAAGVRPAFWMKL